MNRAERRRAQRGRVRVHEDWHRPEDWWWPELAARFGRPVADFVGYSVSAWQWTEFGTCSTCGARSVPTDLQKIEFNDDGDDIWLSLLFTYECGHDIAVASGMSSGFAAPGVRECMRLIGGA